MKHRARVTRIDDHTKAPLAVEVGEGPTVAAATHEAITALVWRHAGARPSAGMGAFTAMAVDQNEELKIEWTRDTHAGITWTIDDPDDEPEISFQLDLNFEVIDEPEPEPEPEPKRRKRVKS